MAKVKTKQETGIFTKPRESRNAIKDIWGPRKPFRKGEWTERVDEHLIELPDHWVQSACVLCSTGCALDIGVKDAVIVGVPSTVSTVGDWVRKACMAGPPTTARTASPSL